VRDPGLSGSESSPTHPWCSRWCGATAARFRAHEGNQVNLAHHGCGVRELTGSVALSTATALVRRMRRMRAAAATRITGGADVEQLAFVVFANAENIQADLVRLLDALEQLAHAIDATCRGAALSNLAIHVVEIRVLRIGY
jgi:hypothetical protein